MSPIETSYRAYNRLVADDFVMSQPKAWEGAIARVGPEFDGWFLSPVFPTFRPNRERVEPAFLEWFCKRPSIWTALQQRARGIGARREAVHPAQFLQLELPLPPLEEQQRVVSHLQGLFANVVDVRSARDQEEVELRQLLLAAFARVTCDAPRLPMRQVAPLVRRPAMVDASGTYPELGIRSFGNGTFHKRALTALEIGGKRIFRIEPGDLLFSNVFAWEGAIAVAGAEDQGRFGSHRFITCVPKPDAATAQFLRFFFLTNEGLELIRAASPGGAGRNRTLGLAALEALQVPCPPVEKQLWFDALQAEVAAVRRLQADADRDLEALLSAAVDQEFREGL